MIFEIDPYMVHQKNTFTSTHRCMWTERKQISGKMSLVASRRQTYGCSLYYYINFFIG